MRPFFFFYGLLTYTWRNTICWWWRRKLYVAKMEEMHERAARQGAKAEKRKAKVAAQRLTENAVEIEQVGPLQEEIGIGSTPLDLISDTAQGE